MNVTPEGKADRKFQFGIGSAHEYQDRTDPKKTKTSAGCVDCHLTCTLDELGENLMRHVEGGKVGAFWTQCTFGWKQGATAASRVAMNTLRASLLIIDLDHTKLERWEIEAKLEALGYAYFAYTSNSHREDDPRYRAVFPLAANVDVSTHEARQAWADRYRGMGRLLGVEIDESCTDTSRLFYLPRHVEGAPYDAWARTDLPLLDFNSLPRVPKRPKDTESKEDERQHPLRAWAKLYGGRFDLPAWLTKHAPAYLTGEARSRGGLFTICPHYLHDGHHSTGIDDNPQGSFATAPENGQGFVWHCSHDSCTGLDRLDRLARVLEAGGLDHKTLCDPECLIDDGATERMQEAQRNEAANGKWSQKAKQLFARRDEIMADMDRQYFVCSHAGQTRFVRFADPNGKPLDDKNVVLDFMSKADFYMWLNHKTIIIPAKEVNGDGKTVEVFRTHKLAAYWYEVHTGDLQRYRHIGCYPNGSGRDVWNTWQGLAIKPQQGDWSKLKWHIYNVLAEDRNEEHGNYIIQWIAWMFQNLDKQAEVALVCVGKRGCGKGAIGRALCRILGYCHSQHVSNRDYFLGRFNEHLRDCVFLFADECFWAGDKAAEGNLKRFISEPTLQVEIKFKPMRTVANMIHLFIASNEGWVVPAGPNERRFAAFCVSDQYADGMPGQREYFKKLYAEMDNGGLAAMVHDLMEMDLGGWHPRDGIPQTKALLQQKERSEDEPNSILREMLEEGRLPNGGWKELDPNQACKAAVYARLCEGSTKQRRRDETILGHLIMTLGAKSDRPMLRGERVRIWTFPPLAEARLKFDARYPWPKTPTEWVPHESYTETLRVVGGGV